jgi:hypothetical protein
MKTQTTSMKILKTTAHFLLLTTTCMLLITSCKKDNASTSASAAVSQDDAAEAITQAVTPESGGMVNQVDQSTEIISKGSAACGASFDSSISGNSPEGSAVTYSYSLDWNWVYTCASKTFQLNFTGNSMYDGPNMSSKGNSVGNMTVTGYGSSSSEYTANITFERDGSDQSKVFHKNSFTSKTTITSDNIKIDKTTALITSGAATVNIKGSSTNGLSFSYGGTLTFNGNKTGTLLLDNGTSYNISWP